MLASSDARYFGIDADPAAIDSLRQTGTQLGAPDRLHAIHAKYRGAFRDLWNAVARLGEKDRTLIVTDPFGVKSVEEVWTRWRPEHFLGWWSRRVAQRFDPTSFNAVLTRWEATAVGLPVTERIVWIWNSGAESYGMLLRSTPTVIGTLKQQLASENQLLAHTMAGAYSSTGPR